MFSTLQECVKACATPTSLPEEVTTCTQLCVDERVQENIASEVDIAIESAQREVCESLANQLVQSALEKGTDYKTRFHNLIQARKQFVREMPLFCKGHNYEGDFVRRANIETAGELGSPYYSGSSSEYNGEIVTTASTGVLSVAGGGVDVIMASAGLKACSVVGGLIIASGGVVMLFGGVATYTALEHKTNEHYVHLFSTLEE